MERKRAQRRRFLKTVLQAGTALAVPYLVPAAVLGKNGAVPPSEQIVMGSIGIGGRGSYVIGCFMEQPDVRFAACCDVRADRRKGVKRRIEEVYGIADCPAYRDFRELLARPDIDAVLITTGSNWHALLSIFAAKAGKDMYCEKPCSKNIVESLALADTIRRTARVFQGGMQRRNLPHFEFAAELAHAKANSASWKQSTRIRADWAQGPAAGCPRNRSRPRMLSIGTCSSAPRHGGPIAPRCSSAEFEKGGGMVGGGCLEWGSHCIDQCQWAAGADDTAPVEYFPIENGQASARYANGVKLVVRNDGWLPLGSCPVRYEGSTGWVETGDSGQLALSSPALLEGKKVAEIGGYPATFHVRDFLDCVKSRGLPRVNAQVACQSHIACHAVNLAIFLKRKLAYDPKKNEFIGDDEANRLRGEALRDPWRF